MSEARVPSLFTHISGARVNGEPSAGTTPLPSTGWANPKSPNSARFALTGIHTTTPCASCHVGGRDVDKVVHDVGSKAVADVVPKFDTPSLKYVSGSAPYFHDGRYKTLEALLNANDAEMGHTLQLTAHQRTDLTAYLEAL